MEGKEETEKGETGVGKRTGRKGRARERKKQDDVWNNKRFVLYYHKEGEPYGEWCQVEKRRMEVERERWKGEVRERMKAAWQRRVDEDGKKFRELYERKCWEEWQRREKKRKEEEENEKNERRKKGRRQGRQRTQ